MSCSFITTLKVYEVYTITQSLLWLIVPICQGATSREESQACLGYPEARMLQGVSQGANGTKILCTATRERLSLDCSAKLVINIVAVNYSSHYFNFEEVKVDFEEVEVDFEEVGRISRKSEGFSRKS